MTVARHRMRVVASVAVGVVVVLVALSGLATLAPASLTSALIARAEHASGRTITVAGGASLSLLPTPSIVLRDATIANPPGFPAAVMARARSVRASFDPVALLTGRIEIASLSLLDPVVSLERLPDGRANWVFRHAAMPAAPQAATAPSVPRQDRAFAVDSLDATGGELAWRIAPGTGGHHTLSGHFAIARMHAQVADGRSSVTLAVLGRHGDAAFEFSAAAGSPTRFATATALDPYPLRAVLGFGPDRTDRISLDGTLADPRSFGGFQGAVGVHLGSTGDLALLFPRADLPAARDVEAHVRLRFDASLRPAIDSFRLEVGAADLSRLRPGLALDRISAGADAPDAPVSLRASGTLDRQRWTLASRDLATSAFWSDPTAEASFALAATLADATLDAAGTVSRRDPTLAIRDATIRLRNVDPTRLAPLFGGAVASPDPGPIDLVGTMTLAHAPHRDALGIEAASASLGGAPLPPSHWTLQVDAGERIALDATQHADGRHWLHWVRTLASRPHRETLALDAPALPAAPIAHALGFDGLAGSLAARADLQADDTARGDIAPASLAGSFDLLLSRGRIDASLARAALAPLLGQAKALLLHGLGGQDVHCASASGHIAGGVATLSKLSLDTPSLTLDGAGTIDLATRMLALTLEPQIRLGPAGASSPVSLTGPIDQPHAALARAQGDRFTLSFGKASELPNPACDLAPGIGVPVRKSPKPLDMLRSLGLFR